VVAQRKAAVAAEITAPLVELNVVEGQRVTTGEVLARLEDDGQQAALGQAKAVVTAAKAAVTEAEAALLIRELDFKRNRDLVDNRVISQGEFDSIEAQVKRARASLAARKADQAAAEAALRVAEEDLDNTVVRAPFNAVVLTKDADVGDIVTPIGAASGVSASVVTIADMTSLQVEADVSESAIARVQRDQPTMVRLDALPGERFPGSVTMIVPTADRSKASVEVKVAFETLDPRVLPEMSAKVAFLSRQVEAGERNAVLAAPKAAIQDGAAFVFRDGKAVRTAVSTGRSFSDQVEILSGLTAGDRVVLDPADLKDGQRIKVAQE
jgi:RND family efflux transporter MFP subunit